MLHAQAHTSTFKPCSRAQQDLDVPAQIHLVQMCQATPENRPTLTLLLSENGVDVYRLAYPPKDESESVMKEKAAGKTSSPARYPFTVSALLVFQDEQARGKELKALMNSPALRWYGGYDDPKLGWQEDWGSIVSFKYETVEFVWLDQNNVLLRRVAAYAPPECITHVAPPSPNFKCGSPDIDSNEVGQFFNYSPPPLSHDFAFLYKVATMLAEGRRPGQHP
jgi:hypothetical protein